MPAKKTKSAKAQIKNGRKRAASCSTPEESHPPSPGRVKTDGSEEDIQGSNVEGSTVVSANDEKKRLLEYIEKLEEEVEMLDGSLTVLRDNETYRKGVYDHWTRVGVHGWKKEVTSFMYLCHSMVFDFGITNPTGRYDQILSKEQKKQLILSMDGWVVQESFDSILARVGPNARCMVLQYFLQIIVLKDLWRLFWQNPFWYLEPALDPDSVDPALSNEPGLDLGTPFGKDVSRLYQEFKRADSRLANHWRAQTVRLANTWVNSRGRNGAFAAKNLAFREAKAKEWALAKYADKTFQSLLKDRSPDGAKRVQDGLIVLYREFAELSWKIAAAQPAMEWHLLKDVPTTFQRYSHEIEAIGAHKLDDRERRLNGSRVLAVVAPTLRRTGGWLDGSKADVVIKGMVILEDPKGPPKGRDWDPSEAKEKRMKAAEEKKAREQKEKEKAKAEGVQGVEEKESSPKGKARKRARTRT